VYDNAASLSELHRRLISVLADTDFEIIYVNDASSDDSLELLWRLNATDDRVAVIDLAENAGQSAAVLAALAHACGNIVVTIDADLENHPEDIPALVAAVRNGADLACGVRRRRSGPLLTRRGPSALANRLVGLALGVDLDDWGCGLNAAIATVVRRLLAANPLPLLPKVEAVLLASRISQVAVEHSERPHGRSTYTVRELGVFAARFLRSFAIRRTLRRLLGEPGSGRVSVDGFSPRRSATRTLAGLGAWALLTGAALIATAWHRVRAARNDAPFRIREIRASRRVAAADSSARRALRDRPDDAVSLRR